MAENWIGGLFEGVIDLTLVGSYCILLVLVVRALLCKAPKWCSYLLWGIVFVRLICPVFPETGFSLIPEDLSIRQMQEEMIREESIQRYPGYAEPGSSVPETDGTDVSEMPERLSQSEVASQPDTTERPMASEQMGELGQMSILEQSMDGNQTTVVGTDEMARSSNYITLFATFWLAGTLLLATYHIHSYWKLKRQVASAQKVEPGVREVQEGHLSFVMGILRPEIYLSAGLPEETRRVVLCHERVHLQRRDYLTKPLALAICCVHWFNPLVWLAFYLMSRDCEMSCDEKVVSLLGEESKKIYSYALLEEAAGGIRREYKRSVCALLSFGEDSVKNRIRHVLHYRKVSLWVIVAAVVAVVVLVIGLGSDPGEGSESASSTGDQLAFLTGEFCDEEGFSFDGLKILDGIEEFEERLARTGEEYVRNDINPAGADLSPALSDSVSVPVESGIAMGRLTVIGCHDLMLEDVGGAKGYAEYRFYNDRFLSGTMQFLFEEYEDARSFAVEQRAKWTAYASEIILDQTTKDQVIGHLVDAKGVRIEIEAQRMSSGSGSVKLSVQENLNYEEPGGKEKSQYFDFTEAYENTVPIAEAGIMIADQKYLLSLLLYDAVEQVETEPGPFEGTTWLGEGVLVLKDAATEAVLSVYRMEEWYEPLRFEQNMELAFCDYDGDGAQEFLIGQYASGNYNAYHMYEIDEDRSIRFCEEVGGLYISGIPMNLSPVLEQTEDGVLRYRYYDNSIGEYVIRELYMGPLSQHRLMLSTEGAEEKVYAFDGFRIGDSYEKMGMRLRNSDIQALVQESTGKQGEAYATIEFQTLPEIPGLYNGGAVYHFVNNKFAIGSYQLTFDTYEAGQDYARVLDKELQPINYTLSREDEHLGEQRYFLQTFGEGEFYLGLEIRKERQRTSRYWGADGSQISVILIERDIWVPGEGVKAAEMIINYRQAEWDLVGFYEQLSYDLCTEDGSMEAARDPELHYEEGLFQWMDQEGAGIDRVEWIGQQDERWQEEWGTTAPIMIYNEEEKVEYYSFAEDCRFLIMRDPIYWSDVTAEELAHYMEWKKRPDWGRWEIGWNAEGEIAWVREGMLP